MFYGAAFLLSLALLLFALLDCIATDSSLCRILPKPMWFMLIVFLPIIGSVAWLLLGRPEQTRFSPGDSRLRAQPPAARPRRPLGPDDDPRFLEMTGGPARSAARRPAKQPEPSKPAASETPPSLGVGSPGVGEPPEVPRSERVASDLHAWEEDLRRREEELRRKLEDPPPAPE